MKSRMLRCITASLFFPALVIPVRLAAQEQPQRYTVTDLGTLGGTFSYTAGLNDKTQLVGEATLPGDIVQHAFLWQNGVMADLGTLGGPNSGENAFGGPNESEQAVGMAETADSDPLEEDFCYEFGDTHHICLPFLWREGLMTPLPTLGGYNGKAMDINNRGQVVGTAQTTMPDPTCPATLTLQTVPALWEGGEIQALPTFPGDLDGYALAINDKGQAVGASGNNFLCPPSNSNFLHALLWQDGVATDLGKLGGSMNNVAFFISNQGQIVGNSDLPGDTTFHAFLWQNGKMTDLGTIPGDVASAAFGINSKGQVVGYSSDPSGNIRAVIWEDALITDLNNLIPAGSPLYLLVAFAINDGERIAGLALQISTGEVHAFLAAPVRSAQGIESSASASRATSERPKITLPENVRKLLWQRLGNRYRIPAP